MATSTIKADLYTSLYYGSHIVRGIGLALSETQIVIAVPWLNPKGATPTITNLSSSITGVGPSTSTTIDTARTNKDNIAFQLNSSGLTAGSMYLVRVDFTLS